MAGAPGQIQREAVPGAGQGAALAVALDIQLQAVTQKFAAQLHRAAGKAHDVERPLLLHLHRVVLLVAVDSKVVDMGFVQAPGAAALPGRPGVRPGVRGAALLPVQQQRQCRQRQLLRHVLGPLVEDQLGVFLDKAGIQLRVPERLAGRQVVKEIQVGHGAADAVGRQRGGQSLQRALPRFVPHDQFGNHGVVVHADLIPLAHPGVHPHVQALLGRLQVAQGAGDRQEIVVRVLGVHPGLEGVAANLHLFLGQRQG